MFHASIRDERGFSLIELLVVIMIVGMLAAIALPSFLGQRDHAQDAIAKSNARNMLTQVEACYTPTNDYGECETQAALGGPGIGVTVGAQPGQVEVAAVGSGFRIRAHSVSGNTFDIRKDSSDEVTRHCVVNNGGSTKGCVNGRW